MPHEKAIEMKNLSINPHELLEKHGALCMK